MTHDEIQQWLQTTDPARLEELWARADQVRKENVGDEVHLRGLIEISNICARRCGYCGLRVDNRKIDRYLMTTEEILACADEAAGYGYGTVVLQAGETPRITSDWISEICRQIKQRTNLAITLSLGERTEEELAAWKAAGADRYLLRFETSNPELFAKIHPPLRDGAPGRMDVLRILARLGYEVGSGVMIGIPGQTWADLANDILAFAKLDLDMIGVGPFIAHPDTPLGLADYASDDQQVPSSEEMTYKVVALTRIVCPKANIPSTSALATLNLKQGRELGLQRGANVVMPNLTPTKYRALYEIYPAKACIKETAVQCKACMAGRILSIGRKLGKGRGDSPNFTESRPTMNQRSG
ncbi:MAG: [FeFe] hydrogenase H-cluster radical SAM maturase HydE [Phycisphaerae bacterium]